MVKIVGLILFLIVLIIIWYIGVSNGIKVTALKADEIKRQDLKMQF